MAKERDFIDFLSTIELSSTTKKYISSVQSNIRSYLKNHEKYEQIYSDSFLSGSYAKNTAIRPKVTYEKGDVDIVVVTNYEKKDNSIDVIDELKSTLKEKALYKDARTQRHSIGVEIDGIKIDIVPVFEDKFSKELYIGSSDENKWKKTDPKGHISWSSDINKTSNMKYKKMVKILKWWRRENCPTSLKYPKGIVLEKIVADNLPDNDLNLENTLVGVFQNIIDNYKKRYVLQGINPIIYDPCNSYNNLLENYEFSDFSKFVYKVENHLEKLIDADFSNVVWKEILGSEFPLGNVKNNLIDLKTVEALKVSHRYKYKAPWINMAAKSTIRIHANVIYPNGEVNMITSNDETIPKGCEIIYIPVHPLKGNVEVIWQIVNTGNEAESDECLRGEYTSSNSGRRRCETTLYKGKHFVQCFFVRNKTCFAMSGEFIINVE